MTSPTSAAGDDRWAALQRLFEQALAREGESREAFVAEVAADDAALGAELSELLAGHAAAEDDFLQPPTSAGPAAAAASATGTDAPVGDDLVGRRIGSFVLRRRLASGGMGVVYEAEQDSPRRTVALKLMRRGLVGGTALRRFELESQVLARLSHPGVAQVHESGTWDDGGGLAPYFAMEFVDGACTLTEHVRQQRLDLPARLRLFAEVCDAVEHGHRKGIVHRDLKPGNILVDRAGRPKVIDFGVARCTDADLTLTSLETEAGRLVGTLQYMSPEQCDASTDIDTRSDVYALGLLLFEMLTDRRPYELGAVPLHEALRIVRDEPPTRLGTLDTTLRGDLETIVGKALEKDRVRRYASAADLRRDVEHFLAAEPIEARPASRGYRALMFVRRNRVLVTSTGVLFLVLVVGITTTAWGWSEALDAQDLADERAEDAERAEALAERRREDAEQARTLAAAEAASKGAINDFLLDMIMAPDPTRTSSDYGVARELKVVDALDRGRPDIPARFADDPAVQAEVHAVYGRLYRQLGRNDDAAAELRAALDLWAAHPPATDHELQRARHELGNVLDSLGRFDEAEVLLRRTADELAAVHGPDDDRTLRVETSWALVLFHQGRHAEAERSMVALLERSRRAHGPDHDTVHSLQNNLGRLHQERGRYEEALALLEEVHAWRAEHRGDDHPDTIISLNNLALAHEQLGDTDRAHALYREGFDRALVVVGPEHTSAMMLRDNIARMLVAERRLDEAEVLAREGLAIRQRVQGVGHPDTLLLLNTLSQIYYDQDRVAEAAEIMFQVVEAADRAHPPESWKPSAYRVNLGGSLVQLGRADEALPILEACHARLLADFGPEHRLTAGAAQWLELARAAVEAGAAIADEDVTGDPGTP